MKRDDLKTLIVVIIVGVICAALLLIVNYKKNSDKLEIVKSNNMYFMVINHVNYYISNVASKNSKVIYDILDGKYIEKNSITEDNIFDVINVYPNNSFVKVKNMDYFEVKNSYVFFVSGIVYQDKYDSTEKIDDDFGLIIVIDRNSSSFSVYPTTNDNYKKDINGIKIKSILQNENNKLLPSSLINKEKMCVFYMTDFVDNIYHADDSGYSHISDEMKAKYTTADSYKEFINQNINKISTVADKCLETKGKKDVKNYSVIDTSGNTYVFTVDGVMNYTVDINFYDESTNDTEYEESD